MPKVRKEILGIYEYGAGVLIVEYDDNHHAKRGFVEISHDGVFCRWDRPFEDLSFRNDSIGKIIVE